ncbi:uncharacterized protein LOC121375469 isoform X2 [Gigantopelta aegis]|uniref:uncharacterized protein LOC121375469 isoform X2 n=1 Tax=Gigantopelta aegis TaxID=1735272 RepID=UPI001B88D26F|nr:uncharacterized protein LOC121375469 isoform X2 [Gigantopelta aegis]
MPKLGRRSERAEFPLVNTGYNQTVQYAPFGNDYSVTFEEKIIGGNLKKVVKRQPIEHIETSPRPLPRLETFQPLTDKPNEINPDIIRSYLVANQAQDLKINQTTGIPTLLASKRPDSKDVAHNYSELDPIDQNRFRNNTSTVFEPELGTRRRYQQNGPNIKQNKDNIGTSDDAENYYPENASPRNVPLWSGNGAPSKKHDPYGTMGKNYPANASPRNVPLWSRNGAGAQHPEETRKPADSDSNLNDLSINQTSKPTFLASKRPDSKDLAHRYSVLQPIEQNRFKNKTSTVFEPEPGVMQRSQANMDSSGKYYPANASPRNVPLWSRNGAVSHRAEGTRRFADDDLRMNVSMMANDAYSHQQSVSLSPEDEVRILQQIGAELKGVNMEQLKQAYLIMTEYDKALSGWCDYKHVDFALTSSRIVLPSDLLRISASQFISSDDPKLVNYEKLLSFIGTAIKQTSEENWPLALYSPRDFYSRPQYYQTDNQPGVTVHKSSKPPTPVYPDQETAKLLSLTEQQLRDSPEPIDFEKLIANFQVADRDLRGTLSAEQIKEVCRLNRLPLQDSLLNQILNRCEDISRDGSRPRIQYHWIKFVQFLERVQPAHTGLHLPDSKKPLDYAKQYRSPVPNWPKPADGGLPDTPLWRKEDSPRRDHNVQSQRYDEPQKSHRDNIDKMNQNLQGLELEYENMRRQVNQGNVSHRENEAEWFPRFMHLANALYDQDRGHTGTLPTNRVWDSTKLHNEGYDLGIPEHVIARIIGEAAHGSTVDIHRYLTILGSRDWL